MKRKFEMISGKKQLHVGDKIYVETHLYISHGSDDVIGGLATVSEISESISGGEKCLFVNVKEHPGHGYNWSQHLANKQKELKKEFGNKIAHADPDIDTPWIEEGDLVDGKIYKGPAIW